MDTLTMKIDELRLETSNEQLKKDIEELNEALKKSPPPMVPTLQVDDQEKAIAKHLSKEALLAMGKKATGLFEFYDGKVIAECIFFAVRVRAETIEEGLVEIAKIVNKLAADGLIHSVLAHPASIASARMPLE